MEKRTEGKREKEDGKDRTDERKMQRKIQSSPFLEKPIIQLIPCKRQGPFGKQKNEVERIIK